MSEGSERHQVVECDGRGNVILAVTCNECWTYFAVIGG